VQFKRIFSFWHLTGSWFVMTNWNTLTGLSADSQNRNTLRLKEGGPMSF